ncbi:hypothetical protein Tco_1465855 [Tanacetum coccineum]
MVVRRTDLLTPNSPRGVRRTIPETHNSRAVSVEPLTLQRKYMFSYTSLLQDETTTIHGTEEATTASEEVEAGPHSYFQLRSGRAEAEQDNP